MKPGDHPAFFRLPPPPGTSRESTIRLAADGTFFHDGERVEHAALHRALAGWIARHPDDGRYILTNGYDWTYLTVDDAPCHVASLDPESNPPTVTLADGSTEPFDPASASVGEDGVVYCRVRGGSLEARFSRHAQSRLAPLLVEAEPPTLRVAGRDYPLPPRPPRC